MNRFNPHAPTWHKQADIPPDIGLEEYAAAWLDMAPHVPTLRGLAAHCGTIVEFGVRGAVSSWAMLTGLPAGGRLISVDVDPGPPLPPRVIEDERFTLICGDSATVELPTAEADLVMIDSSHEFVQTVLELHRADLLGARQIACHDYLYAETPQVRAAIDGFVMDGYLEPARYRLAYVEPSKWGLAVLERR